MPLTNEFTYEFEELELAPGILANGEADFQYIRGQFIMTSLVIGWSKPRLLITDGDSFWWVTIEQALLKYKDKLLEAFEKHRQQEIEYLNDFEAEYAYAE